MDPLREPHREMTDTANRYVLGTFRPAMIACARYSILRARELEIPEKEEAVLDFLMSTAGLDGRAREDLRDAIAGKQAPAVALVANGAQRPGEVTIRDKRPRL